MVEANAKTLRPLVKPALKTAAESLGWRSVRAGAFVAGPELVTAPLGAYFDPLLEGDTYGGVRFGISVRITDAAAQEEASGFGPDALPASPYLSADGGWAADSTEAGVLTDPSRSVRSWVVSDTDDVDSTIEDWAAVLGGPIDAWVAARGSSELLLDTVAEEPAWVRRHPFAVRLLPLIAVRIGRVELARLLLGQYERGTYDSPERIAEFERRLAAAHPEYGALQRS